MLGTLEEELGEGKSIFLIGHAGDLVAFTMTLNLLRNEDIIPTCWISMYCEAAAFANATTDSQFTSAELLALGTVNEEIGTNFFGTFDILFALFFT